MVKGQVYKINSDLYSVKTGEDAFVCKIREVLKKTKTSVLVGDFVEFSNGVITSVYPRTSFITRPAVVNIDQIMIVSSLKNPDLDFQQLDRFLALAKYYNIPPVLCFSKLDLEKKSELQEKILNIYENIGIKVVFTSSVLNEGLEEIRQILNGKITALCGNSGVGKSTLINALNPMVNLKTGNVSAKTKRGTHTTRHCEIIWMAKTTGIIDTPGFSNIRFDFILPKDLDKLFPDIYQWKKDCKFSDCLHINEAGCEVLKQLENISESRYKSYLELLNETFEYKEQVTYNGVKEETHSKITKNRVYVKINQHKRQKSRNTQKQLIYKELENDDE